MSSDLWAAFGSPQEAQGQTPSPPPGQSPTGAQDSDADSWSAVNEELQNAWVKGNQSQPQQNQASLTATSLKQASSELANDEDDDFGDFENPEQEQSTHDRSLEHSGVLVSSTEAKADDSDDFGEFEEVVHAASTQIPEPPEHVPNLATAHPVQNPSGSIATSNSDPFGSLIDFEEQTSGGSQPPASAGAAFPSPVTQTRRSAKEVPVLIAADDNDGDADAWDDFETAGTSQPSNGESTKPITSPRTTAAVAIPTGLRRKIKEDSKPAANTPPPSNIPPPSVLLSHLSGLTEELPEQIRVSIVETWEDDEADVQKHIEATKVAARIIAGRKLRWKRDSILSQSMRIGMAGRQGGMKLAGVDKAESQREDREAAELVRTWKETLGTIRTALAEASTKANSKPPALPLIAANIAVRTLKQEEGGIKAVRCCVLCGLKRDERAERVDVDAWDQFGEWWTEHWGHASCKAFWEEHEQYLQQR